MITHRGEIVIKVIREKKINISKLADTLKINRGTFYNWMNQPNLPFADIIRIGKIIRHDFIEEFSNSKEYKEVAILEDEQAEYGKSTNSFKEKYYTLLEQQNELLRQSEKDYKSLVEAIRILATSVTTGVDEINKDIKKGSSEINESLLQIARVLDK